MNREERIEKARRRAAEHAPSRDDLDRKQASRLYQRLANVGASQAQRTVAAAERSGNATYLERSSTSHEWDKAVALARLITITRAKRRDTITYGEIKWVVLDELKLLLDESALIDLLLAISPASDGVLLGAIAIDGDYGQPSDDFLLGGMEMGFDDPPDVLQRQVYDQFK